METLIGGAAAMLIGLATGHVFTLRSTRGRDEAWASNAAVIELEHRIESVEQALPAMVSHQQLQSAFAQAAQAQQQQIAAAQRMEAQRARASMFTPTPSAMPMNAQGRDPNEFNLFMGQQIDALNNRLQQVAGELGL